MKKERFISPLRYPGGKAKQAKWIIDYFPDNMEVFVEPFVGGGSVALTIINNNKAKEVVINDLDTKLYNFWIDAKNNNDKIVKKAEEVLNYLNDSLKFNDFEEAFESFKENKWQEIKDNMLQYDSGADYYLVNRMGFNGLPSGISKMATERFTEKSINRVKNLQDLLMNASIHNKDYKTLIESLLEIKGEVYMYLDPPYYTATQNLYKDHALFDHDRLAKFLKSTKAKWVLSYDDCEYIRELYKDFEIIEHHWSYSMTNNKKDSEVTTKGKEVIIKNF